MEYRISANELADAGINAVAPEDGLLVNIEFESTPEDSYAGQKVPANTSVSSVTSSVELSPEDDEKLFIYISHKYDENPAIFESARHAGGLSELVSEYKKAYANVAKTMTVQLSVEDSTIEAFFNDFITNRLVGEPETIRKYVHFELLRDGTIADTDMTDEEYQRGETLFNDAITAFSEEVAQNINDVIRDMEALSEKYNGLIISGVTPIGSNNADWGRIDDLIRPLFEKYFA